MGSNFEAGWYNKEKIVNGVDVTKRLWAYEATLAVAVGGGFSGEGAVPGLIVGMSFEKPHVRPGTIGIEALRWLMDDPDVPKGYLLSDRAYVPGPKAKDFQLPVRGLATRLSLTSAATSQVSSTSTRRARPWWTESSTAR